MRFTANGQEYEIRVQQRLVTIADVFRRGEHVSQGIAVRNPVDSNDPAMGERIAVGRALADFDWAKAYISYIREDIMARLEKRRKDCQKVMDRILFGLTRGTGWFTPWIF